MKTIRSFLIVLSLFVIFMAEARSAVSIVGGLTHQYDVFSSDTIYSSIEIKKCSNDSLAISIYQTDYFYTYEGRSYYNRKTGEHARSNASWITIEDTHLLFATDSIHNVPYRICVPDADTLSGTFWSIIMVEPHPADAPATINKSVKQIVRYAIQVITHIGSEGVRSLKVLNTAISHTAGTDRFQVDLENDGTLLIKPKMSLELFNQSGAKEAFIENLAPRIYPGTSIRFQFDLVGVPAGEYQSILLMDCGEDVLLSANYQLMINQ